MNRNSQYKRPLPKFTKKPPPAVVEPSNQADGVSTNPPRWTLPPDGVSPNPQGYHQWTLPPNENSTLPSTSNPVYYPPGPSSHTQVPVWRASELAPPNPAVEAEEKRRDAERQARELDWQNSRREQRRAKEQRRNERKKQGITIGVRHIQRLGGGKWQEFAEDIDEEGLLVRVIGKKKRPHGLPFYDWENGRKVWLESIELLRSDGTPQVEHRVGHKRWRSFYDIEEGEDIEEEEDSMYGNSRSTLGEDTHEGFMVPPTLRFVGCDPHRLRLLPPSKRLWRGVRPPKQDAAHHSSPKNTISPRPDESGPSRQRYPSVPGVRTSNPSPSRSTAVPVQLPVEVTFHTVPSPTSFPARSVEPPPPLISHERTVEIPTPAAPASSLTPGQLVQEKLQPEDPEEDTVSLGDGGGMELGPVPFEPIPTLDDSRSAGNADMDIDQTLEAGSGPIPHPLSVEPATSTARSSPLPSHRLWIKIYPTLPTPSFTVEIALSHLGPTLLPLIFKRNIRGFKCREALDKPLTKLLLEVDSEVTQVGLARQIRALRPTAYRRFLVSADRGEIVDQLYKDAGHLADLLDRPLPASADMTRVGTERLTPVPGPSSSTGAQIPSPAPLENCLTSGLAPPPLVTRLRDASTGTHATEIKTLCNARNRNYRRWRTSIQNLIQTHRGRDHPEWGRILTDFQRRRTEWAEKLLELGAPETEAWGGVPRGLLTELDELLKGD